MTIQLASCSLTHQLPWQSPFSGLSPWEWVSCTYCVPWRLGGWIRKWKGTEPSAGKRASQESTPKEPIETVKGVMMAWRHCRWTLGFELKNNSGLSSLEENIPQVTNCTATFILGSNGFDTQCQTHRARAPTWWTLPLLGWSLPRCTFAMKSRMLGFGLKTHGSVFGILFLVLFFKANNKTNQSLQCCVCGTY